MNRKRSSYEKIEGTSGESINKNADTNSGKKDCSETPNTEMLREPRKFTVEEAINEIGFGLFQIRISIICGIGIAAEAVEMMILSILSPALLCDWGITSSEQALITTFVFVGMLFGSALWGYVSDFYGRKTCVLLCFVLTSYYGLLSAFSPTFVWLYILRGLTGMALIGLSNMNTLQIEFATTTTRVNNLMITSVFWAFGSIFVIALAIGVMPTLGWRWQLALCSIPMFLSSCLVLLYLPESARFHITHGHLDRALESIKKVARENGKPMPQGELYAPQEQAELTLQKHLKDLVQPKFRRSTFLLWYLWFATAFSYYGVNLFTAELLRTESGCPDSQDGTTEAACLTECRSLSTKDYTYMLIISLAEFISIPNVILMMKFLSRKFSIFSNYALFTLFTLLLCTCISKAGTTAFVLIVRFLISSVFQILYIYTLEVFPTTIRSIALGSCSFFARLGGIITPFIAQVLLETSLYATIGVYAGVGLLAGIVALQLPLETKDKVMSEFAHEDIN